MEGAPTDDYFPMIFVLAYSIAMEMIDIILIKAT